jgi:hypothetical protein
MYTIRSDQYLQPLSLCTLNAADPADRRGLIAAGNWNSIWRTDYHRRLNRPTDRPTIVVI